MISQAAKIRKFLLKQVIKHPRDLVAITMQRFEVTRTTVHRHLGYLLRDGLIIKTGTTKQVTYHLADSLDCQFNIAVDGSLSEDEFVLWGMYYESAISALKLPDFYDVVHYGFTEMVNNVIDHSKARQLIIKSNLQHGVFTLSISDDGVGAFYSLGQHLGTNDYREVALDLSKGKLTRDAANHSGQGIFFTSHACDRFELHANGLCYVRDNVKNDWSIHEDKAAVKGTTIVLSLALKTSRSLIKTFKNFQDGETLAFDRTTLRVALAQQGREVLMSRSEAKRLLQNLSGEFTHLLFDFTDIRMIGQGFVDQVFRVYQNSHPEITINYCNANDDVEFMIRRGLPNLA